MTLTAFLQHLVFAFALFLFSSICCRIIINHYTILDNPNHRSSHTTPTPTGGGIAIVLTFFIGMGIIYIVAEATMITQKIFVGFAFSSLMIAGMSFYDDLKQKPFYLRLFTQIAAILVCIAFGIVITRFNLPFQANQSLGIIGYIITFLWILGLTNAYNFMDGLNGMAGANAVVAALFFGYISFSQGSNFTYIVCYTLTAGTLGFLIFNFPKGRLFMGDVGSTFLGFTFATLAIISSLYDNAHTSFLVIPLLLFHFIYDTFFTFVRRLMAGENVFQAHRTHLYQLFNRLGYSHTTVTLFYCAMGIIQGIGAIQMVTISGLQRLYLFLPCLMVQIIYSLIIVRAAKKATLL